MEAYEYKGSTASYWLHGPPYLLDREFSSRKLNRYQWAMHVYNNLRDKDVEHDKLKGWTLTARKEQAVIRHFESQLWDESRVWCRLRPGCQWRTATPPSAEQLDPKLCFVDDLWLKASICLPGIIHIPTAISGELIYLTCRPFLPYAIASANALSKYLEKHREKVPPHLDRYDSRCWSKIFRYWASGKHCDARRAWHAIFVFRHARDQYFRIFAYERKIGYWDLGLEKEGKKRCQCG